MCTARRARTPAWDLFSRGLDDTEQNVRAALDLARKLAAAPSFPEATQIRAEFVRERFAAIQVQARDLNGLAQHAFQQSVDRAHIPLRRGAGTVRHAGQNIRQAPGQLSHRGWLDRSGDVGRRRVEASPTTTGWGLR